MIKNDMSRRGLSIGQQLRTPRAYKRWPALTNSTWYKGMLHSLMAGTADNNGAFDFAISRMRRGTEPPPHIHSREDEFFYVLSGKIRIYVGGEVFSVKAGECIFLPRGKPHAWLITSAEIQKIAVVIPGGFNDALNKLGVPAGRMEVPNDVDTVTYGNADLTETIKVFEQYGVRLLTPDEISKEMPEYLVEAFSPEFAKCYPLDWNRGCQCRSKNKSMKRCLIVAFQHQRRRIAALKCDE